MSEDYLQSQPTHTTYQVDLQDILETVRSSFGLPEIDFHSLPQPMETSGNDSIDEAQVLEMVGRANEGQ